MASSSARTEAAQDISYAAMVGPRAARWPRSSWPIPTSRSAYYWVGANPTVNTGRIMIDLKPISRAQASATRGLRPVARRPPSIPGIALFGQARQDVQIGARVSKTQYQYTLQDPDVAELFKWAPIVLAQLSALPEFRT